MSNHGDVSTKVHLIIAFSSARLSVSGSSIRSDRNIHSYLPSSEKLLSARSSLASATAKLAGAPAIDCAG